MRGREFGKLGLPASREEDILRGIESIVRPEASETSSPDPEQRAAVIAEMDRILNDPAFKKSKRCTALLRHIVLLALDGNHQCVKERILGIEVFGRRPNYDTSSDPIVRMTANEIRKRLAQFYIEQDRHRRVKICMVPGSYLPRFDFDFDFDPDSPATEPVREVPKRTVRSEDDALQGDTPSARQPQMELLPPRRTFMLRRAGYLLATAVFLSSMLWVGISRFNLFRSTQYRIWEPLLQTKSPLMICVTARYFTGHIVQHRNEMQARMQPFDLPSTSHDASADPSSGDVFSMAPFSDVDSAQEISGWLAHYGKQAVLKASPSLTIQDFGNQPVVLVGSFGNPWTVALLSRLRFSERVDLAKSTAWIEDAQNPSERSKTIVWPVKSGTFTDYALITRYWDPDTGNWILMYGGLSQYGTQAATEFLLDPSLLRALPHAALAMQNFQILLRVPVINRNVGRPQLVTVYDW